MYKFIGIGLLSLLVMIIIPISSADQPDDLGTYGMITVAHKDQSGNIVSESQIHNELVDSGTKYIFERIFPNAGAGAFNSGTVEGICLTNEVGFAVDEGETPSSFNLGSTINTASFTPCKGFQFFASSSNSATSGTISFLAGTQFQGGTTITGIGICSLNSNTGVGDTIDCKTSSIGTTAVLLGVVNINDVTPGIGDQIDVTYTVNLD